MVIDNRADGALAQCCMCGKTDLSTAEDGGPECELHDGRWVCSSECWDIAASIIDRLIPRPADEEGLAEAIAELQMMDLDDGDCWTEDEVRRTQSPNDLRVIATILNAVLSGALIPRPAEPAQAEAEPYVWTWQSCESSQGWNTKFGDAPPKPGPWISDVMPLYAHPAPRPAEPAQAAPVAWKYRWKIDGEYVGWRYSDASNAHPALDGFEEVPLYEAAEPAQAAQVATFVQNAVRRVSDLTHWVGDDDNGTTLVALEEALSAIRAAEQEGRE